MSENNTAVEVKKETAAPSEETVTRETVEVDYEAELKKKDDEIIKIREEKENYRRGLLKAKGKIPDEDDNSSNDEDIDARIDRKVEEKLLATKEAQALADKDALVASLAKKNKELSLALKNRGQISSNSGNGSNEEQPEPRKDNLLSNDQISALKAKGWTDKKIEDFKNNLIRGNQLPK